MDFIINAEDGLCVVNLCGCKLNRNLEHSVFYGVKYCMTFAGFLWQPAEAGITYLKNIDRRDSCFNLFAIDYF